MKVDVYTKIILTIIAVCLVILTVRGTNYIGIANAKSGDPLPVVIRGIEDAPRLGWDSIHVEIQNWSK